MPLKPVLIRDADAGHHAETFLVAAVTTVLSIRAFLHLTGYPKLGGGNLHVAHMLWGGLLMGAATLVLLSTLNRQARPFAAVMSGVGFGFFIDELGKFITLDNDYFYRPTVALIYLVFVLAFVGYRAIAQKPALSEKENLANALALMQDVVVGDLDVEGKRRLGRFLDDGGTTNPSLPALRELQARLVTAPASTPGFLRRVLGRLDRGYERLIAWRWFTRLMATFFVGQALWAVLAASLTAHAIWEVWHGVTVSRHIPQGIAEWGRLAGSIASAAFMARGALLLAASRRRAYESFRHATLLAIFVTQFFVFYYEQFAGTPWLVFHLVTLAVLRGTIRLEGRRAHAGELTPPWSTPSIPLP